jgi:hypothetical protein
MLELECWANISFAVGILVNKIMKLSSIKIDHTIN